MKFICTMTMLGYNVRMSEKIRAFIAVDLSKEVLEELGRVERELEKSDAGVKWVRPDSIHVTLKFLGYVEEDKVELIKEKIGSINSQIVPFDISLGSVGVFPNWRRPSVVWVGIENGAEQVKLLADKVEEAMNELEFEKEAREFKAHITLGRVKSSKNIQKLEKFSQSVKVSPLNTNISKLILYKSTLTPKGSIYTSLN